MKIDFSKYQATGNDFVIIDNRQLFFPKNDTKLIATLCDRRFGIGADGVILLENDKSSDFNMVYYNADGREGSMCGNGGRSIVSFAKSLGLTKQHTVFNAVDGLHEARITEQGVSLKMKDVKDIRVKPGCFFLDTGSPHHVQEIDDLDTFQVYKEGKRLRYGLYGEEGANINFVQILPEQSTFRVRTYERGVENETYSCGTGVTAVALAMSERGTLKDQEATLITPGGTLKVSFQKSSKGYQNVWLHGAATFVFNGVYHV